MILTITIILTGIDLQDSKNICIFTSHIFILHASKAEKHYIMKGFFHFFEKKGPKKFPSHGVKRVLFFSKSFFGISKLDIFFVQFSKPNILFPFFLRL